MKKSEYLLKNMGILTLSNFASKILVFLLVPIYTSILSTEEYGSYDLAVSTATLLFPILTLNIVDAVMRFSMDKDYSKEKIACVGMKFVSFSVILFGIGMFILDRFLLWPDIHGLELFVFLYYSSNSICERVRKSEGYGGGWCYKHNHYFGSEYIVFASI